MAPLSNTYTGPDPVSGDVLHDSPDSGGAGPVKIGGIAAAYGATIGGQAAVAAGDRVNAAFDVYGRQLVRIDHPFSFNTTVSFANATTTGLLVSPNTTTGRVVVSEVMCDALSNTVQKFFDGATTTQLFQVRAAAAAASVKVKFYQPIRLSVNMGLCVTNDTACSIFVSGWFE